MYIGELAGPGPSVRGHPAAESPYDAHAICCIRRSGACGYSEMDLLLALERNRRRRRMNSDVDVDTIKTRPVIAQNKSTVVLRNPCLRKTIGITSHIDRERLGRWGSPARGLLPNTSVPFS